jgi:hypothetical protein
LLKHFTIVSRDERERIISHIIVTESAGKYKYFMNYITAYVVVHKKECRWFNYQNTSAVSSNSFNQTMYFHIRNLMYILLTDNDIRLLIIKSKLLRLRTLCYSKALSYPDKTKTIIQYIKR